MKSCDKMVLSTGFKEAGDKNQVFYNSIPNEKIALESLLISPEEKRK